MSELIPFKLYFNEEMAWRWGRSVEALYPAFPTAVFVHHTISQLDNLELKERVAVFSKALHNHLPTDYPQAVEILLGVLGPELPEAEGMFADGWFLMPVAHFVEVYGLEYFEVSVRAMYEITKRHSSEFTIRPFLIRYPEQLLPILHQWAHDPSPHVRRLVSEGTRPRLPWAMRLPAFVADPTPTLALLEHLKDDPSEYVRRSVANHLNDIAKDHPEAVVAVLGKWLGEVSSKQVAVNSEQVQQVQSPISNVQPPPVNPSGRQWIARHALRSLIKAGHPGALVLLGYGGRTAVSLHNFQLEPTNIELGQVVKFSFELRSETAETQNLVVDYVVHHVKANGSTSPKVFKLTTCQLAGGTTTIIAKNHTVRPITTRVYYPGEHKLEVQINGRILGGGAFQLAVNGKQ